MLLLSRVSSGLLFRRSLVLFGGLFLVHNLLLGFHLFLGLWLLFLFLLLFDVLGGGATPILPLRNVRTAYVQIEDVGDQLTNDLGVAEKQHLNLLCRVLLHVDKYRGVRDRRQRENELGQMRAKQILDEEDVRVTRALNDIAFRVKAVFAHALFGDLVTHFLDTAEVEIVTPKVAKIISHVDDVLEFAPEREVDKAGEFVFDTVV